MFKDQESLHQFAVWYDGHSFQNRQGEVHSAVVELAPQQKHLKHKTDPRTNSYEDGVFRASAREREVGEMGEGGESPFSLFP